MTIVQSTCSTPGANGNDDGGMEGGGEGHNKTLSNDLSYAGDVGPQCPVAQITEVKKVPSVKVRETRAAAQRSLVEDDGGGDGGDGSL